jgi:hypothetical protein
MFGKHTDPETCLILQCSSYGGVIGFVIFLIAAFAGADLDGLHLVFLPMAGFSLALVGTSAVLVWRNSS